MLIFLSEVGYSKSFLFFFSSLKVQNSTVRKLHILKDSHGLGVQISIDMNHVTGEKGVFVSDINPGGAAAR